MLIADVLQREGDGGDTDGAGADENAEVGMFQS
jgi:hypothetical protein